jgi:predicted transcriptional regulator
LGKNRDKLSLIAAVLKVAGSGASKTHIMHESNLSYQLLEKYLATVVNAGLVEAQGSKFALTANGHEYLRQYLAYRVKCYKIRKLAQTLDLEQERLSKMFDKAELRNSLNIIRAH